MITAKKAEECGVKYVFEAQKPLPKTSLVDVLEFTRKEVEKEGKFMTLLL